MKIGLSQIKFSNLTFYEITHKLYEQIKKAETEKVDLLCFPELSNVINWTKLDSIEKIKQFAQPIPGPFTKNMSIACKKHKINVILPLLEEENGKFYNSAVIINSNGRIVYKYQKIHLSNSFGCEEETYLSSGNNLKITKIKGRNIGIILGYDINFPEITRIAGIKGCEILFIPGAFPYQIEKTVILEARAHSVANTYFVALINRIGKEAKLKFNGKSVIINPRGEIVVSASSKEELITADIDFTLIEQVRNAWQFYRDRRPETYSKIIK